MTAEERAYLRRQRDLVARSRLIAEVNAERVAEGRAFLDGWQRVFNHLQQRDGHGTPSAYRKGCRCSECRAVATATRAEHREAQLRDMSLVPKVSYRPVGRGSKRAVGDHSHGTTASYRRGCRCAKCNRAHSDYMRDYQRRVTA
jgi:hypothetical protein